PDRVGFDSLDGIVQVEGALNPAGPERSDLEDLPGAAEQRRRAVQHQPLHHPLRGARKEEMDAPFWIAVDVLLQHARELAGLGDQGRKLVQDQRRPGSGLAPEAGEEGIPAWVSYPVKPREEAGDLRRQARSLEGSLPLVAHIVDGPLPRQSLAQEPRLAAGPAAIQHSKRALSALYQPRQACGLFVAVKEGQLH